jgi:hypothetical protein
MRYCCALENVAISSKAATQVQLSFMDIELFGFIRISVNFTKIVNIYQKMKRLGIWSKYPQVIAP